MQPAIVMPFIDSDWRTFLPLRASTDDLKQCFERAFLSISPSMRMTRPEAAAMLESDPFFRLVDLDTDPRPGDYAHFTALYQAAAAACPPEQVLHLCFTDRVSFALQTGYREAFMADMRAVTREQTPLIFHRSESAWSTHPRNYREIERMVTTAGEWLFHKTLDFAWCHIAFSAGQLRAILPTMQRNDLSLVAEMVLAVINQVQTQDVDWLAWEDPFILSREAQPLKAEREQSQQETCKRLAYVAPMLQLLYETANGNGQGQSAIFRPNRA